MSSAVDILNRQQQAVQKGGANFDEGDGLISDPNDVTVNQENPLSGNSGNDFRSEAANWFMEKFQLQICGHRLSAHGAKRMITFCFGLVVFLVGLTAYTVLTADSHATLSDAIAGDAAVADSAVEILRSDLLIESSGVPTEEAALQTWQSNFQEGLAAALEVAPEDIAVVSVKPSTTRGRSLVSFYIIADGKSGVILLAKKLEEQQLDLSSALMTGIYTSVIVPSNGISDLLSTMVEVEIESSAGGLCHPGHPETNCGSNADCVNVDSGHECICREGFHKQQVQGRSGNSCVGATGNAGTVDGGTIRQVTATDDGVYVVPTVTEQSLSRPGHTTYVLSVSLKGAAENMYTLYGDRTHPMVVPACYQANVGSESVNLGGVAPAFFGIFPDSQFDSWLTIGPTEGEATLLSAIGIDWAGDDAAADEWLHVDDGALFWMDPDEGPSGSNIVVAQLTIPNGARWKMTVNAQGNHRRTEDWRETNIKFCLPENC